MRINWDEIGGINKIIKVDGKIIRNVTMADDIQGVVEYVKARKLVTIRGNVEIIGK
jgi:hypothetical protein